MMKTGVMVALVVVALAIVGGALYWYSVRNSALSPTTTAGGEPQVSAAVSPSAAPSSTSVPVPSPLSSSPSPTAASVAPPAQATILYTDNGFSPATLTIARGTVVTFKNGSSNAFWPASNVHPVHSAYDGTTLQEHCANPTATTFDACGGVAPGGSWSFTFNKTGTWQYHNHLNPNAGGTVIVQ